MSSRLQSNMKQKNQGQNNESAPNKNKTEGPSRFKKINLRTMNSDKNSIQEQGGGEPKPYSPDESGQNQQQNNTPPQNLPQQNNQGGNQGQNKSFNNQPFENSEGEQFPPVNNQQNQGNEGGGDFPPQPMNQGGKTEPSQEDGGEVTPIGPEKKVKKGKGNKKLFVGILIAIIVLGILTAAYFFVLPMFSSSEEAPTNENQPAATATTTEDNQEEGEVDVPTVPSADEETTPEGEQSDNTTTTEPENETEPENVEEGEEETEGEGTSEIPANSHQTLFASPADSTVEKVVSTVNLENVKNALRLSSTEVPLFREVVLTDEDENIIQANELLNVFGSEVFSEVKDKFQADPTVYTYTDGSGTWMGLILQIKSSVDLEDTKTKVSTIENNVATVKNFFLSEVGAETSWKDGGVGDVTSRYLSLGDGNASFNYGWSGNKLIISTSYQSFKEAVNKM